ncbi:hypothetical protein GCM10020220_081160 [Nonomuraea rubra]
MKAAPRIVTTPQPLVTDTSWIRRTSSTSAENATTTPTTCPAVSRVPSMGTLSTTIRIVTVEKQIAVRPEETYCSPTFSSRYGMAK